jgi:Tol biopolymer transport system component
MKPRRTRRILALALLGVAATIDVGAAAQQAQATTPGKNGKIAFRRFFDQERTWGAVFVANADGTGARQVTHPAHGVLDDQPDWSPNGSLLVFTRCAISVPCAIYTVKPDGTSVKRLSTPVRDDQSDDSGVSFTPDGRHVVFTRASGGVRTYPGGDQVKHSDLVVMDLKGKHRRVLIRAGLYRADYEFAMFSPDGSQFVYGYRKSFFADPHSPRALFVASADGKHRQQITPWAMNAGENPDWSPDGSRILFYSNDDEDLRPQSQLYTIRADGTDLKQLTQFPDGTVTGSSSFSPDAAEIVFGKADAGGMADVFVMHADGSDIRPVTRSAQWDAAPDWGSG